MTRRCVATKSGDQQRENITARISELASRCDHLRLSAGSSLPRMCAERMTVVICQVKRIWCTHCALKLLGHVYAKSAGAGWIWGNVYMLDNAEISDKTDAPALRFGLRVTLYNCALAMSDDRENPSRALSTRQAPAN